MNENDTKYGAMLSRANAKQITEATRALMEILKRAGAWDDTATENEQTSKALEILMTDERTIATGGGAIKSYGQAEDGREIIGGYLAVWGNPEQRDLHREYFDADSDLTPIHKTITAFYHHALAPEVGRTPVGEIYDFVKDDIGLAVKAFFGLSIDDMREWEQAQIEQYKEYLAAVKRLIQKDVLRWSGGALPQSVVTDADGHIKSFPLIEGSLTFSPAEPTQKTRVVALKSSSLTTLKDAANNALHEEAAKAEPETPTQETQPTKDIQNMNAQEIAQAVVAKLREMGIEISEETAAALAEAFMPAAEAVATETKAAEGDPNAEKPTEEDTAKMKAAIVAQVVKAVTEAQRGAAFDSASQKAAQLIMGQKPNSKAGAGYGGGQQPNPNKGGGNSNIQVTTAYDRFSVDELSYLYSMMKGISKHKGEVYQQKPEFFKTLAGKIERETQKSDVRFDDTVMKAVHFIKANELDNTAQSGYGSDWIPTLWTDRLWERSRLENIVLSQFDMIDMPSNPYMLPVESTDPIVYHVPEATAETELTLAASTSLIPDSKMATDNATLTADKLALRVGVSNEEVEDSIVPFLQRLTRQGQRAIEDALDNVVLNADNTASGNINLDGGTPAATALYYLAWDGILMLPLVTTTSLSVSNAGAAPTLTGIRALRRLLPSSKATRLNDLVFFCDFATYMKLLNIDEFLTVDKYGSQATVLTGEVGKIDNIPVLVSNEMALSATNGKVSSTGGNNLYGRLLLVYKPDFVFGYRRRITTSVDFLPYYDSYQMSATVRPAFTRQNDSCAALMYYIGV